MLRRSYADLFLISFLILFFELAAIRWFGSTVVFLTFFTNIVLLACVPGDERRAADGRAAAEPDPHGCCRWCSCRDGGRDQLQPATGSMAAGSRSRSAIRQVSPQLIYFGTEYRPADPTRW